MDVLTLPCPICGQTKYELGQVCYDVMKPLYLYQYNATIKDRFKASFKLLHPQENRLLAARRCLTCNNVQIFMNLDSSK